MPLSTIAPSLDSAALTVLAGVDSAMSVSQIHRVAGRGSRYGLHLVCERLASHGLVAVIPTARGSLYQLNRDHVLAAAVLAAVTAQSDLDSRMAKAVASLVPEPLSAAIFGSVARGDSTADSDIDLLLIVTDAVDPDGVDWVRQVGDLERKVRTWSGNATRTVTVPRRQLVQMSQAGDRIVTEWERDARTISGQDARGLIRAMRQDAGER